MGAEARLDMATLLLGLLFVWGRIGFCLHPGLGNLGLCLKCACLSWTTRTAAGGRSSSRTSPSPAPWSGGPPSRPWRPLELEKTVNQSLIDIHKAADAKGDAHLCDYLEAEFLDEQVKGIKSIGVWITKIKRAGDGLGLHIIDKEIGS